MIGQIISHYRVNHEIGRGGMGVVYHATDLTLGRQVALKLLRPEETADPDRRARLLREAQTASGLNHPNIVTIYEIAQVEETTYIVMEYIVGSTMEQLAGRPGGITLGDVLRFAVQIADALAVAHAAGIIHRDLKPANIMVTDDGRIKLLDFGLAKMLAPQLGEHGQSVTRSIAVRAPQTAEGFIVGTLGYMSPEQLEGGIVDQRADIFAFGCVLYEMITGRPAFRGDTPMSTLIAVASRQPAPIPALRGDVLPGLERLVLHCLSKEAANRPQRITDVKVDLQALAHDLETGRTAILDRGARGNRSPVRPWLLASGGVILSIIAAAALWSMWPASSGLPAGLTQLTTDLGLSSYPAVSADGRMLAYASDRTEDGALDIWVKPVAGGPATRLTTNPTDDYDPTFSPDGQLIAFRSERNGGGIYTVPTAGGPEQLVGVNGRRPRFSPDGKWIAYSIRTSGGGDLVSKVFLWPVGGGPAGEWLADWGSRVNPVWSPDSRRILFSGTAANTPWLEGNDWWSATVEGGDVIRAGARQLRQPPYIFAPAPELWRPDNRIIFSRESDTGTSIWQTRLDPSKWTVTGTPERLTSGEGTEALPAIGPRGRLVFTRLSESLNIWTLPVNPATGALAGPLARVTTGPVLDAAPWVTRDGKKMAFISNREGREEVWMRDLDTSRQVKLTNSPAFKVFPIVDPAGERLAYGEEVHGEDKKSHFAINTIAAGGGLPRLVCADCGQPRSWVPDGDRILYQAGVPSAFWTVDIGTGKKERVAAYEGFGIYSPRFSFDGRWLVFHARIHPDATRVLIAPYHGVAGPPTEWIAVTTGEFDDDKPRWAPGDRSIYFLSLRDGFRCLWQQQLDPETKRPVGPPQVLVHFHEARRGMTFTASHNLDLSVGLDRMLFTLADRTGNVWMEPAGHPR